MKNPMTAIPDLKLFFFEIKVQFLYLVGVVACTFSITVAASDGSTSVTTPDSQVQEDYVLEEVMVYARKREESLQDTPISISAFSGKDLEARGISSIDKIANFTPNLTFQNNPGNGGSSANAAIFIRGVGQDDFVATSEPGVGLYIDGVYVARSIGAILDVMDIESLEVLRGPQGTLFGRNTIGGAIVVTTIKPDEEFSSKAEITMGSYDRIDAKASINVPISDSLFARFSGATFNRDGYVKRVIDGADLGDDSTLAGRASLRWIPTEDLEIYFSADVTRDRENGPALVATGIQYDSFTNFITLNNVLATGDPVSCYLPANLNNPACYTSRYIMGNKKNGGTAPQLSNVDIWGTNLTVDWNVGALEIKSITAYRDLDSTFGRDGDDSDLLIGHMFDELQQDQFTQELQFLGQAFSDRLNWILGFYYFKETSSNVNLLEFTPASFKSGGDTRSESWAIFSQGTFDINEKLSLTLGFRYTDENKEFTPDQEITAVHVPPTIFPFPVGTPILPRETAKTNISEPTMMASLAYHWTENFMTYISYSEGFKSGGYTQRVFPPEKTIPTFEPEFVDVFEGGFKFSGFNNRFRMNGAVFHTNYDDLQVLTISTSRVGPFIANAAGAEIDGFELDLSILPAPGWYVVGGIGYVDPKYTEVDPGVTEITIDKKFQRVSKWTLNASLIKEFGLGNKGTVSSRLDWSYRSSFYNDAVNTPQLMQEGYHLLDANISWTTPDEKLEIVLGVTNLTDKQYLITAYLQPNFGIYEGLFAREREWYVTARYSF